LDLDLLSFSTLLLSPEFVFSAACLVCRARQAFSCRFAIGFEDPINWSVAVLFSLSGCVLLLLLVFFFLFVLFWSERIIVFSASLRGSFGVWQ
jgi:hypothetical protein